MHAGVGVGVCAGALAKLSLRAADQGKISDALGSIFGIRTGFYGKIVSNLARVSVPRVCRVACRESRSVRAEFAIV